MQEEDVPLSAEATLDIALQPTSWNAPFVRRALSFLDECTAFPPSFVQRQFPDECVKYGLPSLVLPPFEEMVDMARVLDYLGFPVPALQPLIREVTDCSAFASYGLRELPLFSLKEFDSYDRAFLPFLASNGFLSLVQRVYSGEVKRPTVCSGAARNGQLDVLRWLRAQDPPCPWDEMACAFAAQNGHLNVLKWLRSQDPPCPWNQIACTYAAEKGYLEVLQWMRAQVPPCPWGVWTCIRAAEKGYLEVLQWMRAQVPPCPWEEQVCLVTARNGHLNVLQWVRAQDPPCPWISELCLQYGTNKVRTWIWIQQKQR
jgi:hypothetical protein